MGQKSFCRHPVPICGHRSGGSKGSGVEVVVAVAAGGAAAVAAVRWWWCGRKEKKVIFEEKKENICKKREEERRRRKKNDMLNISSSSLNTNGNNNATFPSDKLTSELGGGYTFEEHTDGTHDNFPSGRAAKYVHTLSPTASFTQSVEYLHDVDYYKDYRLNTAAAE